MSPAEGESCSRGARELRGRLAAIRAIGRVALIGRSEEGGDHRLRFRAGARTRGALERLVAVERECCPQLELSLEEAEDEILLTILAPGAGREAAAELAAAFERGPGAVPTFRPIAIEPTAGEGGGGP